MAPSRTVVSAVIKNSPADVAGIQAGDRILALNDDPIYDPTEIIKRVETNPDEPIFSDSCEWLQKQELCGFFQRHRTARTNQLSASVLPGTRRASSGTGAEK